MKRSLKLSIFFTLTLLIAIFVVSCGGKNAEPQTDIGTTGLVYVDGVYFVLFTIAVIGGCVGLILWGRRKWVKV